MPDRIFVENLRVSCRVGLTAEERRDPQDVLVDVTMFRDLRRAGASDSVRLSVDYKEAMSHISASATAAEHSTLEAVAESIAADLLDSFPIERVVVRVRKSKYSSAPSVGIELERVNRRRRSRRS